MRRSGKKTPDTSIVVFDGVCVLCSWFFNFIVKRDRSERFGFATAQSDFGQALYRDLGLPTEDFETLLVLHEGQIYQKLDGFCMVMRLLGWPWHWLGVLRFLPKPVKDWMYSVIAKNRYHLFGKTKICMVPGPDVVRRFVK